MKLGNYLSLYLILLWPLLLLEALARPLLLFPRGPGDSSKSASPHGSSSEGEAVEPMRIGSYVGVKAKYYEGVTPENKRGPPHPAVVVGIDQGRQRIRVAMISHKHPDAEHQIPITKLHPASGLDGNINLDTKIVDMENARYPWHGARGRMPTREASLLGHLVANPHEVPAHMRAKVEPQPAAIHPPNHLPPAKRHPPAPKLNVHGGGGNNGHNLSSRLHPSLPAKPAIHNRPSTSGGRQPSPPNPHRAPGPYSASQQRPAHMVPTHPVHPPPMHGYHPAPPPTHPHYGYGYPQVHYQPPNVYNIHPVLPSHGNSRPRPRPGR